MNDLSALLLLRLPVVPTLLGLGIALALVLRQRAALGGAGWLALGGFGLLLVSVLGSTLFHLLLQMLALQQRIDPQVLRWAPPVVNLGLAVLNGTGVVLLALAVTRRLR
ncbi:hypothetical protein ACF3M1_01760 [Luteimonas sp. WGS1318]|uniref:hypothetical protein n=1 Tax=Luteimonas sp. WGS1318 TaxID=3366815 RepID=UPI00372D423E